jgi:hypothetical protein
MDLVEEIESSRVELFGARQRLACIHAQVCEDAKSGKIDIAQQITDTSIWNNYGFFFIGLGMYSDAEKIYQDMLATIQEVERTRKVKMHKGLALHNLGITQFIQRKFDEAIPNILEAYAEDVKTVGPKKAKNLMANRFKEDLFGLVGGELDSSFLPGIKKGAGALRASSTTDLLENLSESEFLLLGRIILTNKYHHFREDVYSWTVRFDNLRSLCLLLEVFLKRKTKSTQGFGSMIESAFKGDWVSLYKKHAPSRTHFDAATLTDAVANFEANLKFLDGPLGGKPEDDFLARCFMTTVLARHFTAHYFDAFEDLAKDEPTYKRIFDRAVSSIVYSMDQP